MLNSKVAKKYNFDNSFVRQYLPEKFGGALIDIRTIKLSTVDNLVKQGYPLGHQL